MINCLQLISHENLIIALVLLLLGLFLVLYSWVFVFFLTPPAVYSLFCSGVLDCSPAIHQRHCFPLFGAVSWNWERRLGRRGSFFLHSLSSARQRCSHSICMHMIGGHFRWVTELTRHATSIIHFSTRILRTLELSVYSHVKMEAKDFHIQCDKELNLHPLILLILLEPRNEDFHLPHIYVLLISDRRKNVQGKKGMNLVSCCGILILNNSAWICPRSKGKFNGHIYSQHRQHFL